MRRLTSNQPKQRPSHRTMNSRKIFDCDCAMAVHSGGERARDQGEDALHLPLVVDVFGEDVLVEGVAGRAVDEELAVLADAAGPLGEELPAALAGLAAVGGGLELVAGPEDGALGGGVEALG